MYLVLTSPSMFCLLDEPFTHVLPVNIEAVSKLTEREKVDKGIVITDHLYEYVLDISDKIYVIEKGKTNLLNDIRELKGDRKSVV